MDRVHRKKSSKEKSWKRPWWAMDRRTGVKREEENISSLSHSLTITLAIACCHSYHSHSQICKQHSISDVKRNKVRRTTIYTSLPVKKLPPALLLCPALQSLSLPSIVSWVPTLLFFLFFPIVHVLYFLGEKGEGSEKKPTYSFDRLWVEKKRARLNLEPKWQKRIGSLQLKSWMSKVNMKGRKGRCEQEKVGSLEEWVVQRKEGKV